jgi:hypothetical protein
MGPWAGKFLPRIGLNIPLQVTYGTFKFFCIWNINITCCAFSVGTQYLNLYVIVKDYKSWQPPGIDRYVDHCPYLIQIRYMPQIQNESATILVYYIPINFFPKIHANIEAQIRFKG